jgi:hypothetical protein
MEDEKKIVESTSPIKFNEEFEGYYEVTAPAINMRKEPGKDKHNPVVATLMRTQRVTCDGHYTIVNNSKWYKLDFDGVIGYLPEDKVTKL